MRSSACSTSSPASISITSDNPSEVRAHGGGRGRRLRPRHAGARLRHRSAVPASLQADRLGRERRRGHPLLPVGPGPEGRARDALGRRMHPPGQGGHDDPHRAARGALPARRPRAVRRARRRASTRTSCTARRPSSSPPSSPSATSGSAAPASRAIWSSRTSRTARAACATSTRCSGSPNTSTASASPTSWSSPACSTARNSACSAAARISSGRCAATCTSSPGRAEERLSFDIQREIAVRLGYTAHPGLRDVERFMKHYFLVAKDVGDLTAIFCAALEERQAKPRPMLDRVLARFSRAPRAVAARQRRLRRRQRPHQHRRRGRLRARSGQPDPLLPRSRRSTISRSIPTRCASRHARSS